MSSTGEGNDTVTAKAVAMGVLFAASMTLGTIPIKLSEWFDWKSGTKNSVYVQMLLSLGGGVLLCTTFLHLLPEVIEGIENQESFTKYQVLPVAEFLMCAGFFVMYFVEECVHFYLHQREQNFHIKSARSSISVSRGQLDSKSDEDLVPPSDVVIPEQGYQQYHHHIDHSHVDHSHMVIEDTTIISIRGFLVVLALSVHELFEGLSVGLESSSSNVWYMFGAVSAHKLVIAFCIGIELVTSGMKTMLVVIYVFVFAVVSPLGIGIGIAVTEESESSTTVVSVILQGLASGTLLYVVFFEILREERKAGIKQYFSVLLGFIIMLGITLIDVD
ncbi:zinc transporter ZIP1 [Tribolium castaneum]|uniref:zinc transporter ZIP1 n=1 Tax=Tribolium castaneum TaxID=7070 RepID=UPI0000D55A0E|nr:PREDICTED: zinc transporter ZIP1 [Tribolium castaneum]XP_974711.1 PREDICTED: zinc transporter ZIP1 [Tribolium castaneum]|eukprot:XP_008190957.1 PREDICTED: zinc transporter ZIP1 [Tribolium castaneum]